MTTNRLNKSVINGACECSTIVASVFVILDLMILVSSRSWYVANLQCYDTTKYQIILVLTVIK